MSNRTITVKALTTLLILITAGVVPAYPQTQEYVEVINIQLILRALKNGVPIAGLRQSDITLFENGKPIPLTSFQEIRRKVGRRDHYDKHDEEKPPPAAVKPKQRLFFLYFRVIEPDPKIQEALDYFFNSVYRGGDYVLLLFRNRAFPITTRARIKPVMETFNAAFSEGLNSTRLEKQRLHNQLERAVKAYLDEMGKNEFNSSLTDAALMQLLTNCKMAWQQYRTNNITLEQAKLNSIAAALKKVDIDKWGFVFYQQDNLPVLNPRSIFRSMKNVPANIQTFRKELEIMARDMSETGYDANTINDLQRIFIEANITFHLLLSSPTSLGKLQSAYVKSIAAQTDWQQVFRRISAATGGGVIVDNKLQKSLAAAVEREDVYYRLTYAPAAKQKERRNIRIKTSLPGVKLQYHRKVTVAPPGQDKIAIRDFSFKHPVLAFKLNRYRRLFDGARLLGDIEIKITAVDHEGKTINFRRSLEPDNEESAVSMNLNFSGGGQYSLIVEALDRRTQKKAIFSQKITVPKDKYLLEPVLVTEEQEEMSGGQAQRILGKLLKKTAIYCQKLKKTTFYFTCTEEVIDNIWLRGNKVKEKSYFYDYQIIKEDRGKMNETRRRKSVPPDGQEKVLTNFVSSYPYLMPIGMLSEKNRSKYRYRLLGSDKIKGREFFKVSVGPREDGVMLKDFNYGTVWIDETDGSVYKIKIDPNSLGGIDGLKSLARQKRNRLQVTDIHTYDVLRNGVRFPSKTQITCAFFDWDSVKRVKNRFNVNALEQAQTVFQYKQYKFFDVKTDVVESGHR